MIIQRWAVTKKISIRERRKLRNIIVAALLFLGAWVLFSPWGFIKYYRISSELEEIRETNLELEKNNRKLEEEIQKLTSDPEYIERVAREHFGMVKKNELVFDFSKQKGR